MPPGRASALWGMILCFLSLLGVAATAHAHFLLNLNVRILHVEHLADGLRVYLRTPDAVSRGRSRRPRRQ